MQPIYKSCPSCGQAANLQEPVCLRCGHIYRTRFAGQSQVFQTPPPAAIPYQPFVNRYQPLPPGYLQTPSPAGTIWVAPGAHSSVMAVLLSLFCILGMGQIYNKQIGKGVLLLLIAVISGFFTAGISLLILYPLAAIDAGMIAGRLNRGEAIRPWQWF